MNQSNPYSTPETPNEAIETDVKKLAKVAVQLSHFRKNPPSLFSILMKPTGLPLRLFIASICVSMLFYVSANTNSPFTSQLPIAMAAFFLGSMLRDYSYARVYQRWWPANMYFLDWSRVEEFTQNLNDSRQPTE